MAEKQHYIGHRQRLRSRFLTAGPSALADYELLELILFAAHPRGDVKPLAKKLLNHFGSFAKVITAEPRQLAEVEDMGDAAVTAIKTIQAAAERLLREQAAARPIIQSWTALLDYCRLSMGHKKVEEFHVLYLNHKHGLICDDTQQVGTVDHTPVYPREVVKRALEVGASSMILVHNHPSGDITPSKADIEITQMIIQAAEPLGVEVIDHLIIGTDTHYSFKSHGLI